MFFEGCHWRIFHRGDSQDEVEPGGARWTQMERAGVLSCGV